MAERYSYSKLECYENCPYAYKLKYVDGHYVFCNSIATEFGTLVHATEEAMFNNIKNNEEIDYVKLKNNAIVKCAELEKKYFKDFNTKTKNGKTYKDEMYDYLNYGIYRLKKFHEDNPNIEFIDAEKKFNFKYKDKVFTGFIDRVFRYKDTGKYLIQDLKTWNVPAEKSKLNLSLQFVVYCLSVKDLYNAEPGECICQYDMPLIDLTQTVNLNNLIGRGKEKLDEIFNHIDEKDFHAVPSPLCFWCPYSMTNPNAPKEGKGLCPYFSHWTKEKRSFSVENKWQGEDKDAAIYKLFKKMYNINISEAKKNG